MENKIVIGSDHAGFELKQKMIAYLKSKQYSIEDYGTNSPDSVDYPDFAHPVASAIEGGEAPLGVLICGSGVGVCITANKHAGIRAALAWNKEVATLGRQHNDANIVCLPARFIDENEAKGILDAFLTTAFEGGRHATRVSKMQC